MTIQVIRDTFTPSSTSSVVLVPNTIAMVGLEPPRTAQHAAQAVCIPEGTFSLGLRWSPKHNMYVPAVNDVPGRTDIEIHPGNFPEDTLGCLLVGLTRQRDCVLSSRTAFARLMMALAQIPRNEHITIEYTTKQVSG